MLASGLDIFLAGAGRNFKAAVEPIYDSESSKSREISPVANLYEFSISNFCY